LLPVDLRFDFKKQKPAFLLLALLAGWLIQKNSATA
jgi:hypothetical protein